MLVDTDNLVSAEDFRTNMDKYVAAAESGGGPIAITQGSRVLGFFVGADEFEAAFGSAVKELLQARSDGATITQGDAEERVRRAIQRKRRKS
jgi:hypothetical protein